MAAKKTNSDSAGLRRHAERDLAKKKPAHPPLTPENADTLRLLHELDVHRIELELQNSELRQARDKADAIGEKYTELYDFAPVGYFTLARDSTVLMVNLTGATLTGIVRSILTGRRFDNLVAGGGRAVFRDFLEGVFEGGEQREMDTVILSGAASTVPVSIRAFCSPDGTECLAAVTDITERTAARLEQAQLLKRSREHEQRLLELSRQLIHAQENERKRISRELHDVIAHALLGINFHLAALDSDPDPERVADVRRMVGDAVETVHRFARELRPAMLDDLGLIPAMRAFLKDFLESTGLRPSLRVSSEIEKVSPEIRTTLFRISQEALANVAAHAHADSIAIDILIRDGSVVMEITDDGYGFDTSRPVNPERLGLTGMKERAEMTGGEFSVDSRPGGPTVIRVSVPNLPIP